MPRRRAQPADAVAELRATIDFDRHNLACTSNSPNGSDDSAEADRAATSLVEASPQEAENHQAWPRS